MTEVVALLGSQPIGEVFSIGLGTYELRFSGYITTMSGVTAQNLMESIYRQEGGPSAVTQVAPEEAFLSRLMTARPDLKDKIAAYVNSRHELKLSGVGLQPAFPSRNSVGSGVSSPVAQGLPDPVLLHGYAWRKSDSWIGTYGDLDTLLAWKFLESPLIPAHEFTFRLVPSLADDVFEHCRILRMLSFQTEAGVFRNAIECLYVIDYGILSWSNMENPEIGYSRAFDYGTVVYAPTVGPVYCYERKFVEPGDPLTLGAGDLELSLIAADILGN
jgi:hypothetical protein